MRVLCRKTPGGAIIPANGEAEQELAKIKAGRDVWVEVKRAINSKFRSKWEVLIDVGFDAFEPPEIEHPTLGWITPAKNRSSFRDAVKIAAGFFHLEYNLDGSSRIVADSVAFEKLEDDSEFERRVYSPTIDVLMHLVFRDKTAAEIRDWAERIVRFDS